MSPVATEVLHAGGRDLELVALEPLVPGGAEELARMPATVKILLENAARLALDGVTNTDGVERLASHAAGGAAGGPVPFRPARVLLQDHSGGPVLIDLAAIREAVIELGGDPAAVDLRLPADLVVDHSIQVDHAGARGALGLNMELEYRRNRERYEFFRWAAQAFAGLRVVPPGQGIVHQVHLERLAPVVALTHAGGRTRAVPDTVVGTDSHTPMINGLGVLGWGVGGIDATAALLGEPMVVPYPRVVGVRLDGELPPGATTTDLALSITAALREHGVVGKFVEFCGESVAGLSVQDRATLSNMAPEYGATAALWPIDDATLDYLRLTGRDEAQIDLVERYARRQGLFGARDGVRFDEAAVMDLSAVEPSVAGPSRPQDRVPLARAWASFAPKRRGESGASAPLSDGAVAVAAITSCTNTSNAPLMLAAGLVARRAVELGLGVPPWVKTSLAPGSRVVQAYLERAGLLDPLERLGFHVVGYGCTTCIGNSGPLAPAAAGAAEAGVPLVAVLSGNRNFEGRIHPQIRGSYLASPPLVVAYALAGTLEVDLTRDALGHAADGTPVRLADLWPAPDEVAAAASCIGPDLYLREYASVFEGDERWSALTAAAGPLFPWDPGSTSVMRSPFADDGRAPPAPVDDIVGARALVVGGDSVTTDHLSPAGAIPLDSPAAEYLRARGVPEQRFNTYGCSRGNHEVMARGTFGNVRLRNALTPGREGGWTRHLPSGEEMPVFEAAQRYGAEGVPLVVLAGRDWGMGSSRDWAAKGLRSLGVRAVIARGFERIHRSNLAAMGVLPLELAAGSSLASLGIEGTETFDIRGLGAITPGGELEVRAHGPEGTTCFPTRVRLDAGLEVDYLRHGGVLPMLVRSFGQPGGAGRRAAA